jgi:hypothetical protein
VEHRGVLFLLLSLLGVRAAAGDSFTLPLPGTLVQAVAATDAAGRPGIALLVAAGRDGKGAKSLLFLDPERRALVRLADGLHEEVNALAAFDLAGNGTAVPIAGMPGVLFAAAGGGGARRVLEEPDADLRSVTGATAGRPWLAVARTGRLELLAPAAGGTLARRTSFPLPVRAERLRWGLRLSSPPVTLLAGEPPVFAVGPEAAGRRRLETLLLPAAGGETIEAWSLLPQGERLTSDRRYLRVDGLPMLAATTFGKLGLFAKKRLRLFLLERDRSRQGSAPGFAVETDCPLWFPLDVAAAAADADGRQDLVLAHPGGLRGKELLVVAYRGLGGGRFAAEPRRWKLNQEASDWLYGTDLTGDGVPDLLVLIANRLFLYAGDPKGARPLAPRPLWAVTVAGAPRQGREDERRESDEEEGPGPERERYLMAFDLPGGRRVALARGIQKDGRTILTVVRR